MVQVVNKATGEVYEYPSETPEQIRDAWIRLSEDIKALERAKGKLKPLVDELLTDSIYPIGDYQFRRSIIERKTYDKSVLREVIEDEDLLDTLLVPDKTRIDEYIKENLESLGDGSTKLRESMVPIMTKDRKTGEYKPMAPYSIIRLEKL